MYKYIVDGYLDNMGVPADSSYVRLAQHSVLLAISCGWSSVALAHVVVDLF